MKILHTADWHLGKKLEQSERTDEQQHFLDWLIERLSSECIDVLIIAGDVFDCGSPSNTALQQYYGFLRRVKNTCCREVVIIGGNHDSVTTLNAPKDLLKYFNVHIVGGVPEIFTDQLIRIKNDSGNTELVICAVPFLRDRDIRLSVPGETSVARARRISQGISDHYNRFIEHILSFRQEGIPVIATGHLFAAGSGVSDSEKEIHVGNLGQVSGDQFPVEFDYVALGHIHRPQRINNSNHIRYSGSPIPLSFSETEDRKMVIIVEFNGARLSGISELEVPCCRKLIRIKGDFTVVKSKLQVLTDPGLRYPAWVEVQVETESFIFDLDEQLNKIIAGQPFIERLFIRQHRKKLPATLSEQQELSLELYDLEPRAVFEKRCQAELGDDIPQELLETFDEVLELMRQH